MENNNRQGCRWTKASEGNFETNKRYCLRLCKEYLWTGEFVCYDGEEMICKIDGQNKPMRQEEFSEIEYLSESIEPCADRIAELEKELAIKDRAIEICFDALKNVFKNNPNINP